MQGGPRTTRPPWNSSAVSSFRSGAFGAVLALASTIFWVWMLIECATKEKTDGNRQMIWIVVIAVTHVVGALIYFLIRRPDRIEEYGE